VKKFIFGVLVMLATTSVSSAQWSKPVSIHIANAAGGANDLATRIVLEKVSQNIGQKFVYLNDPGASGYNAATRVVNAPADGYNFLATFSWYTTSYAYFKDKFDTSKLTGVAGYSTTVLALVTNKEFKTVADLKNAKRETFRGCGGVGSPGCVYTDTFDTIAELKTKRIIYPSAQAMNLDLAGGRLDYAILPLNGMKGFAADGTVNILAVTGDKPYNGYPIIPSIGYSKMVVSYWVGLLARPETPKEFTKELEKQIEIATKDKDVIEALAKIDALPQYMNSEQFNKQIDKDLKDYSKVYE